jgi:alpha-beta hydrolase superfamily lysophospholipase
MDEIEFTATNAIDGKSLMGRYWPAEKPVAFVNLMHGLGEHCGRYAHLAAHLNSHGISVASLDQHGHGRTQGKRGVVKGFPVMRGNVDALIAYGMEQAPDLPQFLMGHSMGGGIVLDYGFENPNAPIKAIIAQAPFIEPVDAVPGALISVMKVLRKIAPNMALKAKLDPSKITTLKDEQDKYFADPLNHTSLGTALGIDMIAAGKSTAARAGSFPFDLLITHGTDDKLTQFKASQTFASKEPRAKFIAYEGCGHEVHNDFRRDRVYADLSTWILERA